MVTMGNAPAQHWGNAMSDNALRHGHCSSGKLSPTYQCWKAMKRRCDDIGYRNYNAYGGAGIAYAADWASFDNFLRDMGERPPTTTLDRVDNSMGYSKGNCRWATRTEQNRNRTYCVLTAEKAKEVFVKIKAGVRYRTIAAEYGCSEALIGDVKHGRAWADATLEMRQDDV